MRYTAVAALALALSLSGAALAQTNANVNANVSVTTGTSSTTSTSTKEQQKQERKEERQEAREEKREERKLKLQAHIKTNIQRHFNRAIERIERHLNQLRSLANRIEARIKSLDAQAADTTETKASLAKARASWQQTKDGIAAAGAKLNTLLASETPRTQLEELRRSLRAVRDDLKETHAHLVRAVKQVKGLRVGAPVNANGNVNSTTNN